MRANLPNQLTLSRVFLGLLFCFFVLQGGLVYLSLAALTVVAAFISDLLDGHLARRWRVVSHFGICFDPVVDKVFVLSAFAALVALPKSNLPVFPLILIMMRELLVLGLRVILLVSSSGLLPAERFGKIKAAIQFSLILAVNLALLGGAPPKTHEHLGTAFWLVGFLTVISGIPYFWKNREALRRAWASSTKKQN
ncbi:MAG: CDP-alcohol phosphatidyltransferase family protein [Elusimicrobia bacterium]|nr:CDP-alcohol phosphatidyltransferase family protein [Elusimicrobiota bacterium]